MTAAAPPQLRFTCSTDTGRDQGSVLIFRWGDCFIAAPWCIPTTYGTEVWLSSGNGGIHGSADWGKFPGCRTSRPPPIGGVGSEPEVGVAGLDQPALIGERDRLGTVGEPEFREDAGDV